MVIKSLNNFTFLDAYRQRDQTPPFLVFDGKLIFRKRINSIKT